MEANCELDAIAWWLKRFGREERTGRLKYKWMAQAHVGPDREKKKTLHNQTGVKHFVALVTVAEKSCTVSERQTVIDESLGTYQARPDTSIQLKNTLVYWVLATNGQAPATTPHTRGTTNPLPHVLVQQQQEDHSTGICTTLASTDRHNRGQRGVQPTGAPSTTRAAWEHW